MAFTLGLSWSPYNKEQTGQNNIKPIRQASGTTFCLKLGYLLRRRGCQQTTFNVWAHLLIIITEIATYKNSCIHALPLLRILTKNAKTFAALLSLSLHLVSWCSTVCATTKESAIPSQNLSAVCRRETMTPRQLVTCCSSRRMELSRRERCRDRLCRKCQDLRRRYVLCWVRHQKPATKIFTYVPGIEI